MSKLFFPFDLTNSLLAEKPLAEKSSAPTSHPAHANAFDALLLAQMKEAQNASLPESLPESLKTDLSKSLAEEFNAPDEHRTVTPASTESTATESAPLTSPPEESLKEAADEPVAAYGIAPLAPLPAPNLTDNVAESSEQTDHAAPPAERAAATAAAQPARSTWHFDRNLPSEAAPASTFTFAEPARPQVELPGSTVQTAYTRTTQKAQRSLSGEPLQSQRDGANARVPQPANTEPTVGAVIELPQRLNAATQPEQLATATARQAEGFKQTRVLPAEPFETVTPSRTDTGQPAVAAPAQPPAQPVEARPAYSAPAPSHSQAGPALRFGFELPPAQLGNTGNEQPATRLDSAVSTRLKSTVPAAAPLDSAVRPTLEQVNEAVGLVAGNFDEPELTGPSLPIVLPDESKHVIAEPAHAKALRPVAVQAAAHPEPVSQPLTAGQVVRTVLKDDYPFVRPALPNAATPYAPPARPESSVPPATPVATASTIPQPQPGAAALIVAAAEQTATLLMKPQSAPAPPSATTIIETATAPAPRRTLDAGLQPQPVPAFSAAPIPPALRDTDDGLVAARRTPFSTVLPERLNKAGQRTFQLVLQAPAPVPAQTQRAIANELPRASAAQAARFQQPAPLPLPLEATTAPGWPSTEPTATAEPSASKPQAHTLSVSEPGAIAAAVPDTQVLTPLDHCEAETLPPELVPELVTEPLRASLSKIEQHLSNSVQQMGSNVEVATQPVPAPIVQSAPVSVASRALGRPQAVTVRELIGPRFYPVERAEPAASTPEPVTPDLTDEGLGQRQIPDRQVPLTTTEGVGTLTPMTAAAAELTAQPVETRHTAPLAPAAFSTNVTTNLWAANLLSNNSAVNWAAPKPAPAIAGAARWTATINQITQPVTQPVTSTAVTERLPLPALSAPLTALTGNAVEAPLTANPRARTTGLPADQAAFTPPVVNTEPAPAQPLQRAEPLVTGLAEITPLPTTPHEAASPRAASPRAARWNERAVDNKAPAAPLLARAAPQVTPAAPAEVETLAAPALRRAGVELKPAAAFEAARPEAALEVTDEAPVNAAKAPLTPERGTTVAQHTGTRDENFSHVARQLAEPLITASAGLESNEPRTIRLKLRPAALGVVEIELRYDASGQLNARLTAEREQTTHVLRGQLGQLREALEQAGLQVGTLDIATSSSSPEQRGQGWHAGGQDAQHAHTPLTRMPAPAAFAVEPTPPGGLATAQDRLINLHA